MKERIIAGSVIAVTLVCSVSCGDKGGGDKPEPVYGDTEVVMSVEKSDGSFKFLWSSGDAIAVSGPDGTAKFTLKDGAKTGSASFAGDGAAIVPGTQYKAYYPYSDVASGKAVIDLSGGKYNGGSTSSLHTPLYGAAAANADGGIKFSAKQLAAFIDMDFTVPVNGQLAALRLIPSYDGFSFKGELDMASGKVEVNGGGDAIDVDLSGVTTSSKNREVNHWAAVLPHDYSSQLMLAAVEDAYGDVYTLGFTGADMKGGKVNEYKGELVKYEPKGSADIKVITDLSNISAIQKNISLLGVPYGQFSGIAHVEGGRYAVAHDQAKGGGIYFLELGFDDNGNVISASQEIPEATSKGAASRDVEGIVYVPSTRTFFTSGEGRQDILEYDMEGKPTGRKMEIPSDMALECTQNNQGFESLAYNAKTGLFWTTTEAPLKKDMEAFNGAGRLIRLQSFGSDLMPAKRFFYLIDKPEMENEINSATYGYGVPDLLALDDGRLIVMERELYANTSSLNVWCKVRLYLVDPVKDKSGILEKSLIASFRTNTGALADYEGMCEGPTLSDGTKTILLICDSAGGKSFSGFRLSDHILTIAYR